MFDQPAELPIGLWVETQLAALNARGVSYYITQKGNHGSGVVLLKLLNRQYECSLLIQQRDLDGKLGWVHALNKEVLEEREADEYIQRSIPRDPDMWVIEIEQDTLDNPFEE